MATFAWGDQRTITINRDSFAAIAYSPATGKYGFAYDLRSRAAAEKAALENCKAEDARVVAWVNDGFCALALGADKTCWGAGWSYGPGSNNDKATEFAVEDCKKRTTGGRAVLVLSSDGQYFWDLRQHTTITDKEGNVYDGYGNLVKPSSGKENSSSSKPSGDENSNGTKP